MTNDFLDQTFRIHSSYLSDYDGLGPLTRPRALLAALDVASAGGFLLVFLGCGAAIIPKLSEPHDSLRRVARFCMLWMVIEVFFASLSGRAYPHYAQAATIPAAVMAGFGVVAIIPRLRDVGAGRMVLRGAVGISLALTAMGQIRLDLKTWAQSPSYASHIREVATEIRSAFGERTSLLIWGSAPAIYLELGTSSPSRYTPVLIHMNLPGFATAEMNRELAEDLADANPDIVLDATTDPSWDLAAPDSTFGVGLTPTLDSIGQSIRNRYRLVKLVGPWRYRLYARTPPQED